MTPDIKIIGWISLAMGSVLLAPQHAARFFGLGPRPQLMRAIGARDLIIGLGLLRNRRPSFWLRLHALADAVDATIVGHGLLTGTVARWRGLAWVIFALGSGWVTIGRALRLDAAADPLPSLDMR